MKTNFIGNKPFVYISFASEDRGRIGNLIDAFDETGICYAYADKPSDDVTAAIRRCAVFVTVMSAAALKDERFLSEITSAKNAEKTAVAAMLERDLDIPGFVQLQVNRFQNLFLYRHGEDFSLKEEISRASVFSKCSKRHFLLKRIIVISAALMAIAVISALIFYAVRSRPELPAETTDTAQKNEGTASPGLQYEIADDAVSITGYFGEDTTVTVPETYMGFPVTKIASAAFRDTAVTSVNLPSCVTEIGEKAFYNCQALEHVISYGKEVSVGDQAFYRCITKQIEYKKQEAS